MHGCRWLGLLTLGLLLGCSSNAIEDPLPVESTPPPAAGGDFDPDRSGTIEGEVKWVGEQPQMPALFVRPLLTDPPDLPRHQPHPQLPIVDAATRGVGNAVVFLRGVDPRRQAGWSHDRASIVMKDFQFEVVQGQRTGRVGFVWPGAAVEMVSRQEAFHALRASGAAFFTVPFPDAHQPVRRRFTEPGLVELASGAGYFWMRAHLFVVEHPYFAATDEQGRFTLRDVPDGRYEWVCWLPNWNVRRQERDPESGRVSRLTFDPPLEKVSEVEVQAGAITSLKVEVGP